MKLTSFRLLYSPFAVQILLCGFVALGTDAAVAAKVPPDLTGVWTLWVEPGQAPAVGGGAGFGPPPVLPFTPEGQRRNDEYKKLVGPEQANPGAYCTDYGMPMMMEMAGGYLLELIQRPDQLTMIFEVEGETRRIWLGSRQPAMDKRLPSRQGFSVGHWEGDTLVVKTTDLTDGVDQWHPHSDQAEMVERFTMHNEAKGAKSMDYSMTMTDPVYYTKPIVLEKKFGLMPNGFLMTYRCPDEFWLALLEARREQLKEGKPVTARMSDVYKAREAQEGLPAQ